MSTTVDDVHHRNRHCVRVAATDVTIERHIESFSSSLCSSQRYTEDSVCTEFALCRSSVEGKHLVVYGTLIEDIVAFQCRCDDCVYVLNSFQNAFTQVTVLVTVAKLEGFVLTCRCSRRNSCTAHYTIVECYFNFYCRISS